MSKEKDWTKEELTIFRNGPKGLAKAVIRQWLKDGAPAKDLDGIRVWLSMLVDTTYDKDNNNIHEIGD